MQICYLWLNGQFIWLRLAILYGEARFSALLCKSKITKLNRKKTLSEKKGFFLIFTKIYVMIK